MSFAQITGPAKTPPMGWNSYNCFGATVTEAEVKANADFIALHLKRYGWEYIVIDYCWFYPYPGGLNNPPQDDNYQPRLTMDNYGRLMPAIDRFPSAAGGKGFKPLADYIHSKGLKFGIHVMRGIPRQAVHENTSVLSTDRKASDVADTSSICGWLDSMYGVDVDKKGGQEYYNSLLKLYAEWGVDYIKVDDQLYITRDGSGKESGKYHHKEIEAVNKAIAGCGRTIVYSLSPGDLAPIEDAGFLKKNADLWRVSQDFWDEWESLKAQFERCNKWSAHTGNGNWPDADMLQLGLLSRRGPNGPERASRFTPDEQILHMTLWSIFRSPLMYGGDLTMILRDGYNLITNPEIIAVNQNSTNNHQLFRRGNHVAWIADVPGTSDKYLALFNLGEDKETPVYVLLGDLGITGKCSIRDLWSHKEMGVYEQDFCPVIAAHGAGMFKITPK
jgi:hypothetical protein